MSEAPDVRPRWSQVSRDKVLPLLYFRRHDKEFFVGPSLVSLFRLIVHLILATLLLALGANWEAIVLVARLVF